MGKQWIYLIYSFFSLIDTDYDLLEKLISDTYKINLDNDPSMYPLLMSEPSLIVDKRQRERLCKIAFESLKVPGFYIYKSGALSV